MKSYIKSCSHVMEFARRLVVRRHRLTITEPYRRGHILVVIDEQNTFGFTTGLRSSEPGFRWDILPGLICRFQSGVTVKHMGYHAFNVRGVTSDMTC